MLNAIIKKSIRDCDYYHEIYLRLWPLFPFILNLPHLHIRKVGDEPTFARTVLC